ncbi:MAG: polyprenyl diphosphate synthase [Spirochaetia bacterium]
MDPEASVPAHVGIIMDGNGRWATLKGLPRTAGHREGLQAAKRSVRAASDLGISYLTLYVFSTENWRRAESEVSFLMRLIQGHLRREYDFYRENRIRVIHSGDPDRLPEYVRKELEGVVVDTKDFEGLTVNLAINYGGRDEIVRAVNRWTASAGQGKPGPAGRIPRISAGDITEHLDCRECPDVDMIIRTGGEIRLSNFLLWSGAYAELYFSDTLWPDWQEEDLRRAVEDYQRRERRYGGTS